MPVPISPSDCLDRLARRTPQASARADRQVNTATTAKPDLQQVETSRSRLPTSTSLHLSIPLPLFQLYSPYSPIVLELPVFHAVAPSLATDSKGCLSERASLESFILSSRILGTARLPGLASRFGVTGTSHGIGFPFFQALAIIGQHLP